MPRVDETARSTPDRCGRGGSARWSTPSESERRATSAKHRVLVVEDDRDIRDAIMLVLEHEGYEVVLAPDGKEALDLLQQGVVPGLILLDLMMPVMNGWDFRRRQLADPALASIPVIVLSADPLATRLADSPGVCEVLVKPVDVESLLRSLERICAR